MEPNYSSDGEEDFNNIFPKPRPYRCPLCNEDAKEVVTTQCGHLFCRLCLQNWLEMTGDRQHCPKCNCCVSMSTSIPLYGYDISSRKSTPRIRQKCQRSRTSPNVKVYKNDFRHAKKYTPLRRKLARKQEAIDTSPKFPAVDFELSYWSTTELMITWAVLMFILYAFKL